MVNLGAFKAVKIWFTGISNDYRSSSSMRLPGVYRMTEEEYIDIKVSSPFLLLTLYEGFQA